MVTTVMVTGAGGGVGISILKALQAEGHELVGVDSEPEPAGADLCDHVEQIRRADAGEYDYIGSLCDVIRKHDVDVLIPGTDHELVYCSWPGGRNTLGRAHRTPDGRRDLSRPRVQVISPHAELVGICRSKLRMAEHLRAAGVPAAQTVRAEAWETAFGDCCRVVFKPDAGSRSVGLRIVSRLTSVYGEADILAHLDGYVAQEHLEGPEFTVGVYLGTTGQVMGIASFQRKLKGGSTWWATTDPREDVEGVALAAATALGATGPINVQMILTDIGPVIHEINPRFSGTCSIQARAGVNGPALCIEEAMRGTVPAQPHRPRQLTAKRYLQEAYS